jgi:hypothetical protein
MALLALLAVTTAACGGGSASSASTAPVSTSALVKPPPLAIKGCNYEIDGAVPPGMSTGVQPPVPSFVPSAAAVSALRHIRAHGGSALVDGFTIPPGTVLRPGPGGVSPPVATVPGGRSLLLAEPVLWTTAAGQRWIATFLACGGPNLYWIEVTQIARADRDSGAQVANSIALALAAPPSATGVSVRPIVIDDQRHFAWASGSLSFAIARGIYQSF